MTSTPLAADQAAVPADAHVDIEASPGGSDATPASWPFWRRQMLRFGLLYFLLYFLLYAFVPDGSGNGWWQPRTASRPSRRFHRPTGSGEHPVLW